MRRMASGGTAAMAAALVGGLLIGALPSAGAATTSATTATITATTTSATPRSAASLPALPNPLASPSPTPSPTPTHRPTPRPSPTVKPTRPKPATVVHRVTTKAPVFFITVDDGYTRDPRVIDLVKSAHIPLTAFLIRDAAKLDPAYFRRLRKAGAVLEDHTLSHPYLTSKTPAQQRAQICNDALYMNQTFGRRPTLFRPPYGKYDKRTLLAASACGFRHVVLWDAVENAGAWSVVGGTLAPGMIVILHFTPSLYDDLRRVLAIGKAAGLRPALLERYLPGAAAGLPKPGPRR